MQNTNCTLLKCTFLLVPMLANTHLISACSNSNGSPPLKTQRVDATPEDNPTITTSPGTIAVSSEALFDFLYSATRFEFWSCLSSDTTEHTYIALDSKDDETDEGFNPLLLLGLRREPQLLGDPRALNEIDRNSEVELETYPVSFTVTGSDSISIAPHTGGSYTPNAKADIVNLTAVRTGPGRSFIAEDQSSSSRLTCTAENVGADIMF